MKHVQTSLNGRNVRESSFHNCGGLVRLIQASLCARNPDKTSEEVP